MDCAYSPVEYRLLCLCVGVISSPIEQILLVSGKINAVENIMLGRSFLRLTWLL